MDTRDFAATPQLAWLFWAGLIGIVPVVLIGEM